MTNMCEQKNSSIHFDVFIYLYIATTTNYEAEFAYLSTLL